MRAWLMGGVIRPSDIGVQLAGLIEEDDNK
jgi:hypothetical protein